MNVFLYTFMLWGFTAKALKLLWQWTLICGCGGVLGLGSWKYVVGDGVVGEGDHSVVRVAVIREDELITFWSRGWIKYVRDTQFSTVNDFSIYNWVCIFTTLMPRQGLQQFTVLHRHHPFSGTWYIFSVCWDMFLISFSRSRCISNSYQSILWDWQPFYCHTRPSPYGASDVMLKGRGENWARIWMLCLRILCKQQINMFIILWKFSLLKCVVCLS